MAAQRRTRLTRALVVLAAAGVALSGCAAQPGTAAVVNGTRITENELDDATLEYVSLTGQKTEPVAVLSTLIAAEVLPKIAADHGVVYSDEQVIEMYKQQAGLLGTTAPKSYSPAFVDLGHYLFAALDLQSSPEGPAVMEEFTKAMADADIDVNPRYGQAVDGSIKPVAHDWIAPTETAGQGAAKP
ncbi:hypothetical protein [Georgenia sp. SYP-B2076]|uniref:hypothetical protein n=1 Tax=Georgenia sp. SYP-B2076 TaxID=2495881 RepID=UPI000F8EBD3C|nr:hypothetical protein [Georgenia sp. SYP-B2076]